MIIVSNVNKKVNVGGKIIIIKVEILVIIIFLKD